MATNYELTENGLVQCFDPPKRLDFAGRWIPVTEALPETSKPVLCTIWHGEYYTVAVGHLYRSVLSGKTGWCMDYPGNINNVIAWMPLPEAYRREKNEE